MHLSENENLMLERGEIVAKFVFPTALILLDIGAAIVCFVGADYKRAVYWIAAAVLNVCVTI